MRARIHWHWVRPVLLQLLSKQHKKAAGKLVVRQVLSENMAARCLVVGIKGLFVLL
jgi:hypothetical protein